MMEEGVGGGGLTPRKRRNVPLLFLFFRVGTVVQQHNIFIVIKGCTQVHVINFLFVQERERGKGSTPTKELYDLILLGTVQCSCDHKTVSCTTQKPHEEA